MARLDATAVWFERGEDAEALAATESTEVEARRVPTLAWVAGAVTLTAAAFGAILLFASHASAARSPAAGAGAAAATTQPTAASDTPPATSTAPVAAPHALAAASSAPLAASSIPVAASSAPTAASSAPVAASSSHVAASSTHVVASSAHVAAASAPAISPDITAAEKLLRHGHAAAALTRFQTAIAHDGADQRALRGACVSLSQLSRLDDAARVCRRALERNPSDLEARRALASAYYAGGAYKWSAAEWRRVVEQSPRDVKARRSLHAAESRAQKS